MWWKKHKWKVVGSLLAIAVLAGAFWYGGDAPGLQGWSAQKAQTQTMKGDIAPSDDNLDASKEKAEPLDAAEAENPQETESKKTDSTATGEADKSAAGTKIQERPGGAKGGLSASDKVSAAAGIAGNSGNSGQKGSESYSQSQGMTFDAQTGKDSYQTNPVPEGKPVPVEPQDTQITDQAMTCTLSVRCDTILSHMGWLDADKAELVPEDGVIFPATQVTFYQGESVFNVLQREMKKAKIHLEFKNTPVYNSAYIEGIQNLYEFDCGDLSGWMYKVNDWFPNYGCNRYQLQDGDVIQWVYTCDLGVDVGGYQAAAS